MDYQFPRIGHISQVLKAIEGDDSFIVVEKDGGYTVVNYVMMGNETFPPIIDENDALRRECRGLVFDTETGRVKSRRLHKFFNAGERDETQLYNIDISQPHIILEKLDGSMVTPLDIGGGVRWGTKMGVTDIAMDVENFVADHPEYDDLAKLCFQLEITPIFEWCSRSNRIIIDHPVDRLVLLAVRDNYTGEYHSREHVVLMANSHGIEVVGMQCGTVKNMEKFIENASADEEHEGYVIRFEDGHCMKVKTQWYVNLHRTKDALRYERNLVSLILANQIDDQKSFMLPEDLASMEIYVTKFWENVNSKAKELQDLIDLDHADGIPRKEFALWSAKEVAKGSMTKFERSILFRAMDVPGASMRDILLININKYLSNNRRFEMIRPLFGEGLSWTEWGSS